LDYDKGLHVNEDNSAEDDEEVQYDTHKIESLVKMLADAKKAR
jgi:hypothetical protein